MKFNYHTHTQHCRHAGGLPEDYAKEACLHNLKILGFSDHAPFPDTDYGFRMPFSELDEYINECDEAKEKFKDKLQILKSLEIEWLPQYSDYYEKLLTEYKMDYLLLGEHFFQTHEKKIQNITSIPDTILAVEYAENCAEAMKTGYFKIFAHPDLFCINEPFSWNDDYEKASDIIIEAAVKTNTILEFNANGLRRGIKKYPDEERYQYPHKKFWNKAVSAGITAVVGSDAHDPKCLWDGAVEESIEKLKSMNVRIYNE